MTWAVRRASHFLRDSSCSFGRPSSAGYCSRMPLPAVGNCHRQVSVRRCRGIVSCLLEYIEVRTCTYHFTFLDLHGLHRRRLDAVCDTSVSDTHQQPFLERFLTSLPSWSGFLGRGMIDRRYLSPRTTDVPLHQQLSRNRCILYGSVVLMSCALRSESDGKSK
jgi:hypothetical protein